MDSKNLLLVICCVNAICIYANAEICTSNVCEFIFEVRHARSMTLRKDRETFNVHLNGSQLEIESPDRFARPVPEVIDPDDVITLDGFQRNLITINKTVPGPAIEVMEGAQVVVKVRNLMLSKAVAIHWHGIHQRNTTWMDGVPYVTQCPIIPRQSFTYRFRAYPPGTHWYHSHLVNQRNDGLFGMLIVHKRMPASPEYSLMVSDWHHSESDTTEILSRLGNLQGPGDVMVSLSETDFGPDNVEISAIKYESSLINARGRYNNNMAPLTTFVVAQNGEYRFRTVNAAGERTYEVSVDDHELNIVALDGADIEHIAADSVIVNPGERVDFIIQTNKQVSSYWIRSTTMRVGFGQYPRHDGITQGTNAILKYEGSQVNEPTTYKKDCSPQNKCRVFNCQFAGYATYLNKKCIQLSDAYSIKPPNELAHEFGLSKEADMTIFLNPAFTYGSSINAKKFAFTSMPWSEPRYKEGIVSCDTDECNSPDKGCACTHIQKLPFNKTVDLVMVNSFPGLPPATGHHAMHLHGHNFAVLKVGFPAYNLSTGFFTSTNNDFLCQTDLCKTARWNGRPPQDFNLLNPPIKDTILVPALGYVVIRFRSDNPGPWLLHCHSDSHLSEGMTMLFDEAIDHLPPTPKDFPRCHPFDWSEGDLLSMEQNGNHGNQWEYYSSDENESEESESEENIIEIQENERSKESTLESSDKTAQRFITDGQVMMKTADFIGLIVGCIAFGAVLVLLVSVIFHCCQSEKMANTKL